MRKFFLSLFLLGIAFSLQGHANPIQITEYHLIHKIVENQRHCVLAFEGNKIFLSPEHIVSTNRGLFINLDGIELHPLPVLQFNRNGHFIQGSFMPDIGRVTAKKKTTMGSCPACDIDTDGKGICQNPACMFYRLRVL